MSQFTEHVQLRLDPNFLGGGNGRILPDVGKILDLVFLREALRPGDDDDFEEEFLPERIFVREEMETAFKEILNNGKNTLTVFSGSPGIGKSVLMFLVVLYRVANRNEKAIYMRRIDDTDELVSKFAMERKDGTVDIRFTRHGRRGDNMPSQHDDLRGSFEGVRWHSSSIVDAVDGPRSTELTNFSKLTYGCTSGAGIRIKHHMVKKTFNVVMGGWKKEDLEKAIIAELNLDPAESDEASTSYFDTKKFDDVYFVNGGRIRGFLASYTGSIDTSFADDVVASISKTAAELSLSHSNCRSTDDHVHSLRTMFRTAGGTTDSVNLHVDSGYLLRKLRAKINGEELFNSFKRAQNEGNKGAEANYFEELLHWCVGREGVYPSIVGSIHAEGSGTEGVKELDKKNLYWIPSIPNFANIDSAVIGSDGNVWCYQYTVTTSHLYKKHRMKSRFLDHIPIKDETAEVIIVFVFPKGTPFTVPDTAEEVETQVYGIDCSSLETVLESVRTLVAKVARPDSPG